MTFLAQEAYDTGRIHVFLIDTNDDGSLRSSKGTPFNITLKPDSPTRGARFGAALACLDDTDSDGFKVNRQ